MLLSTDWLCARGEDTNFEVLPADTINQLLIEFYRYYVTNENLPKHLLQWYPIELTQILTAAPFQRSLDISNDKEFTESNQILQCLFQDGVDYYITTGEDYGEDGDVKQLSVPHLQALYSSQIVSGDNPTALQNKVWLDLNLHFGVLNRIFLRQLQKTCLVLDTDQVNGRQFYKIVHKRMPTDKLDTRMYDQPGSPFCPVASLSLYLSKLNAKSDVLFQQPKRESNYDIWYSETAVGKNVHSNKLATLCQQIGIKVHYKNTALRLLVRNLLRYAPDSEPAFSDNLARVIAGDE